MRLLELHDNGSVSLTRDLMQASEIPAYAILSHTWGPDAEEVTFEDLTNDISGSQKKPGYEKIRFCGEQAKNDGLRYFWVDSCCINKANYTELSLAINSMFRWYQKSSRCYVYLADVSSDSSNSGSSSVTPDYELVFKNSKWFTRGWTLQELLAPSSVEFFSQQGEKIGDKRTLEHEIHKATGIAIRALQGVPLEQFSITDRISWAAKRNTTIEEDQVYCVLGIFGVYMPLIYGEGAENAMRRLRKEISLVTFEPEASRPMDGTTAQQTSICLASLEGREHTRAQPTKQISTQEEHRCAWIFTNPKFRAWLDSNTSDILWVTAKAGCGKSTLALHISETISMHLRSPATTGAEHTTNPVVLTYFFQRSNQEAGQTALEALKMFTKQLVEQLPELLPILLSRYTQLATEGGFAWSWANLSSILSSMLKHSTGSQIYIIVDAIDECGMDSQAVIIDWMQSIVEGTLPASTGSPRAALKVLATSRPTGLLLDVSKGIPTLEILETDTASDIHALIHNLVDNFAQTRRIRQEVANNIAQFLEKHAQGMFIWVILIMKELEKRDERLTDEVIMEKLSSIPLTIMETYKSIIHAPLPSRRKDMWKIIRWLLYGSRDMTLDEIEIALCLEDGSASWYGFAGDVEYLCGSLIRQDNPKDRIGLVHQTARSFLEAYVQESSLDDTSGVLMGSYSAHEELAVVCIRYLSRTEELAKLERYLNLVTTQEAYVNTIEQFLGQYPFFRYAIEGWTHHVREAAPSSHLLNKMIRELFSSHERRTNVLRLTYFMFKHGTAAFPVEHEPVHLAAYFNLTGLLEQYVSEERDCVNAVSDADDTPLVWASEMGNLGCVRALLQAGADPNAFEYDGWSALHWAARNDHVAVAELLLMHGAKVDQRDSKGYTPMDWALDREHIAVVEVLRRWGAGTRAQLERSMSGTRGYGSSHEGKNAWKLWDYRP